MEPKYIPYSWYEYPANKPPEIGRDYICVVLTPDGKGGQLKRQYLIYYSSHSDKWKCDWGIVTHWMLPIPMP